ncbi:helix-turn-helix transcriptional regulator [Neisseriaceae bacterium JH1-16]|nr:helix-turn-helix transcriptional regulator [Neisseriaceae bacterium JH1-16]
MSPSTISLSNAGDLIACLGTSMFPARLWAWLRNAVEPHCYQTVAIRYRRNAPSCPVDSVDVLFFFGESDPDITRLAVDLYLKGAWKRDAVLPYIERLTDPQLVFLRNEEIAPTEYGYYFGCGQLGEECTLLGCERDYVYAFSIFRRRDSTPYTMAELSQLRQLGDFLLPLLYQHARLAGASLPAAGGALLQHFEQRLNSQAVTLSPRERWVCQAVLQGQLVAQIAEALAIRQCSVRTYFNRALAKIGVESKAELFAWCVALGDASN